MTEPRVIGFTTSDGVRLAARYWPASNPDAGYVLAHGFTGSSATPRLMAIARRLADRGAGVLVPDLRGHGRSGGRSTVGDVEIHDVAAAVAWLRAAGYRRVAVLGWSMGGSVVLRYAGLGGDADAVVSISSPGVWFERGTRPMRVVHWLCEGRPGRVTARLLRRTRLDRTGWRIVPEAPASVVGRIAPTPLLFVHGDADRYFPMRHAQLLAEAAPGASVWLETGMGHAETATTPDLVERIAGWLDVALAPRVPAEVCDDGRRD